MKKHFRPYALTCLLSTLLMGCQESDDAYNARPVDDLYNEAQAYLKKGEYTKSAKSFAEIERQHPYSNWAVKAQLMAGYAYYQAKKYDEAIENFNVFIGLHPTHEDVAYAHYMIGICYYEQMPITERDQKTSEKSLDAFKEIINKYPDSKYAKDAKIKLDLIHDHLAGKEMDIGRFYEGQKNFLAASNRFKFVVEAYQTSSHAPEALYRLVECYLNLGLIDQAKATAAVLGHNYPGSNWYQEAYKLLTGK